MTTPPYAIDDTPARQISALWLALGLATLALILGALLGLAGPLITVGALLALGAGLWALTSLEIGLWGSIAIITLLPFAALPFKIVFTPNFLDLALGAVVFVYALQWMTGYRRSLTLTPAHAPIGLFLALAVFSFVAGMPNGPLTTNLLRQFVELLLNILLVFIVVDYVDSREKLARICRAILFGGIAAAALGIGLYLLPSEISNRALSALGVFGYPTGDVLRFVEDNPLNPQRAISTSVDPNFLGGMLAMVGGLLLPQVFTSRPVLGQRSVTLAGLGLLLTCLVLTFSRGAMAALALAALVVAALRYRRLLVVILFVGLVIAVLPVTQEYVTHFVEGLRGEDLATQMRFGEYKDALLLIQRYPVLGVGFAGAPEIDLYLGVSSAYLLMAEQMGLIGLIAFTLVIASVFGWAHRNRHVFFAAGVERAGDEGLGALWLGLHAGLVAALAVGVVDHYFFQLRFQSASSLFWLFVGLALAATRLGQLMKLRSTAV